MKVASKEVMEDMPRLKDDGRCMGGPTQGGLTGNFPRAARLWRENQPHGFLKSAEQRARACKGDGPWRSESMERARDCFLMADWSYVCISPELTHADILAREERFLKRDPQTKEVIGVVAGCYLCGCNTYTKTPPSAGGYTGDDSHKNQVTLPTLP